MIKLFYLVITLAFVFGCSISLIFPLHFIDVLYYSFGVVFLSFLLFIARRHMPSVIVCIICISLLFGIVRVSYSSFALDSPISKFYESKVEISGIIINNIEQTETRSRYILDISTINGISLDDVRVLVYEPYPTSCVLGEKVFLSGVLRSPEDFVTGTGRVFRYKKHLAVEQIYGILSLQESSCIGYSEVVKPFGIVREIFLNSIHSIFPSNEAGLLAGLILGVRSSLSSELLEAFRITGLLHIVVLSGYNITIVAEAVRRLFSRFTRVFSTTTSIISIILFVLLAGSQVASVRAGLMGAIGLFAKGLYREYSGVRILTVVAGLMVLYNPVVLFSSSFHLSFLATFGLLVFSPLLEDRMLWITDSFQVRSIIAITISTQILLLPYLAYAIGEVSIIAILTNIVILPIIPIAMLFGAIIGAIGLVSTSMAIFLSPIAYLPLAYMTHSVEWFATVPYAVLPLFSIPWWTVVLFYIALCGIGLQIMKR